MPESQAAVLVSRASYVLTEDWSYTSQIWNVDANGQ